MVADRIDGDVHDDRRGEDRGAGAGVGQSPRDEDDARHRQEHARMLAVEPERLLQQIEDADLW